MWEGIMRSLWELDRSTAVPNNWQAKFGMAPATQKSTRCNTDAFPKLFTFREVGTQVSLVIMSHPSPRTVAPLACLPLNIKDSLKVDTRFFDGLWLAAYGLLWDCHWMTQPAAVCLQQSSFLHQEVYTWALEKLS
jgi:hypothetical protein